MENIYACDPLSLSCSTDPTDATKEELPDIFYGNLEKYGVAERVRFNRMRSDELAESWQEPLKVLWIDGDHTYPGVQTDISSFQPFLTPGSVICFHDVLHGFEGPIRVFMESVLLSREYGACGLCGSIGWGQFIGSSRPSERHWKTKLSLYKRLSRFMLTVIRQNNHFHVNQHIRKFYKALVPHGPIDSLRWINSRNDWQTELKQ